MEQQKKMIANYETAVLSLRGCDIAGCTGCNPCNDLPQPNKKDNLMQRGLRRLSKVMKAILPIMIAMSIVSAFLPKKAEGSHPVGYKVYQSPAGVPYKGYHYEWRLDKYGCGYWYKVVDPNYTYQAAPVTQYIINMPAYEPQALRGDTKYGVVTFQENIASYGNPDTSLNLLSEITKSGMDGLTAALGKRQALATQSLGDQVELLRQQLHNERERTANERLEKLALLAKATEPQPSVNITRNYGSQQGEGSFPIPVPQPNNGNGQQPVPNNGHNQGNGNGQLDPALIPFLNSADQKCQRCHSEATAASLGDKAVMPLFNLANKEQWNAMLIQISRADNKNCAVKAGLSLEEVTAMLNKPKPVQ